MSESNTDTPTKVSPVMIVFSYWPLLDPRKYNLGPGETISPQPDQATDIDGAVQRITDQFTNMVNDIEQTHPHGRAESCIWGMTDDHGEPAPMAIFIMPRAKEISEHLLAWSEGKPQDWFNLYLPWRPGKKRGQIESYGVLLMPKLDMSIQRLKFAHGMKHGAPMPADTEFRIIFQPLYFGTGGTTTFERMQHLLGKQLLIEVMDSAQIDRHRDIGPQLEAAVKKRQYFHLGAFPLLPANMGPAALKNKTIDNYLRQFLDDLIDPS